MIVRVLGTATVAPNIELVHSKIIFIGAHWVQIPATEKHCEQLQKSAILFLLSLLFVTFTNQYMLLKITDDWI